MKIKEKLYNYLKIDDFKGNVTSFVEAKIELLRMDVEDRFIEGIVKVVYLLVFILVLFLVLIFGLILAANLLNLWLESRWIGQFIVFLLSFIPFVIWKGSKTKINGLIRSKTINELEKMNSEKNEEV